MRILVWIFLLAGLTSVWCSESDTVSVSYESVFEQLLDLAPDPDQALEIENFTFNRDVGEFHLRKGTLFFCKPIEGRVFAAIFKGEGNFSFEPPTEIERQQFYRFYERTRYSEKFKTLFLVFADDTYAELTEHFALTSKKVKRDVRDHVSYAMRYLSKKKEKLFDVTIMKTLLDGRQNGLFYAHFSKRKTEPFFFAVDPYVTEEVQFMRRLKGPSFLYVPEVISQFHKAADYVEEAWRQETDPVSVHIDQYDADVTLEGHTLDFSAVADIRLTSKQDDQNWLHFILFNDMEVDSAFWENGRRAVFVKEKKNPFLWVKCDTPLQQGDVRHLKLFYQGKLIERNKDWFYIKSSKGWYPVHGDRQYATFDLTFTYPDKYEFVSVGELVSSETTDGSSTTHWVTDKPVRNASFNIGFFKKHEVLSDTLPPITVLMAETGHSEIGRAWGAAGVGSGRNMEKNVGNDVTRSIHLFQEMYGEAGADRFIVSEIPYLHGEAFPGLIHLSWITFQRTREHGSDEIFRAHEVAHQWWGIGVDIKSYHDQWLSEGISEFSGWRYYQQRVRSEEDDEKKFYNVLKETRKRIIDNRKFLLGDGQKAAPIWLGYRTHSSDTRGDYNLIIYKKGAWVLQMLRSMLLDLDSGSEEKFEAMMRDFYQTYLGRKASTEDFMDCVAKHFGQDMSWFFDQWVFGTEYPEYSAAYKIDEAADGQYQVRCRIEQKEVPENFRMPMLVGIDFGDDDIIARRIDISGPPTEYDLGNFERKPKKVIFNYLESVLCKIDESRW